MPRRRSKSMESNMGGQTSGQEEPLQRRAAHRFGQLPAVSGQCRRTEARQGGGVLSAATLKVTVSLRGWREKRLHREGQRARDVP
jgi:hypothetical protein